MDKLTRPENLYDRITDLLKQAQKSVVQTVNNTMVLTYFEIGRIIVNEEQSGKGRADYGQQLVDELSERLTKEFGKGFSATNIKQMRSFYLKYSKGQTVSDEFNLSWSHYGYFGDIDPRFGHTDPLGGLGFKEHDRLTILQFFS